MQAPHGIPFDVLDRLLIIRTLTYTVSEIEKIIGVRAAAEKIPLGFFFGSFSLPFSLLLVFLTKMKHRRRSFAKICGIRR